MARVLSGKCHVVAFHDFLSVIFHVQKLPHHLCSKLAQA